MWWEYAVPEDWRNLYYWMKPTLTWLKSQLTPLAHYASVDPTSPGCTSDCPGAQWCPGPDLGWEPPGHIHHLTKQHVPMLCGMHTSTRGPCTLLSIILSCCNEISGNGQLRCILFHFDLQVVFQPSVDSFSFPSNNMASFHCYCNKLSNPYQYGYLARYPLPPKVEAPNHSYNTNHIGQITT